MSIATTQISTSGTLQEPKTNPFGFLVTADFWTKIGTGLLVFMCLFLIFNLITSSSERSRNVDPNDPKWVSAYGNFLNGVYGFTFNTASKPFIISYPVMNNKQVGIQLGSTDGATIIFLGFNEVSALIDTIANSYYDPNLQSLTDISVILAQTKLLVPIREIQNGKIVDTTRGSYTIWFSLDADTNTIMNIASSSTVATGSSISITPHI